MTADELERLYALLRVPSVSAVPAHAGDMHRAAAMMAEEVRRAGGTAEVRTTDRHPLVLGEVPATNSAADAPRVIVYGHYDVQPPGPEGLWTSPPFEPTVRAGRLYARGASDDKGNLFMLACAVQRLAAEGRLPVRVSFVIDGEEESGGTSALDHIAADPERAAAALIFDSVMAGPGRLTVCTGVRGLVYRRLRVRAAQGDGHSGLFGGAAMNAAHVLGDILRAVTPVDGRLPEALYAGLAPAGEAEVAAWADLPPGARILADSGLRPADAGAAEGFHLRTLALPAVEVHGLRCGDVDAVKTTIPAEAEATLSMRVAPGQDARALAAALDALLRAAAPEGAEVEIEDHGVADAAHVDPDDPVVVAASRAMSEATGWPVAPVRIGGTLPIVAVLAARGVPTVLSGFALPEDAFHGPDESLVVDHLEIGTRAAMAVLTALGDVRR